MKKKEYTKPEMQVVNITSCTLPCSIDYTARKR